MPLNYYMIQRKNPLDQEAPKKWYPQVEMKGRLDFEGLTKRVATASTASEADCSLVLKAMVKQIALALNDGMSVVLEDIGTFSMGIRSLGTEEPEEWNVGMIKSKRVTFRACVPLMREAKQIAMTRVLPRAKRLGEE